MFRDASSSLSLLMLHAEYSSLLQNSSIVCITHVAQLKLDTDYKSFLKSGFMIWLALLTPLTSGTKYADLFTILSLDLYSST